MDVLTIQLSVLKDLHQSGLMRFIVSLTMSMGYLIPLAGNFAIIILRQGRVVSGWLPSFSGTLASDFLQTEVL